jgi:hypothetical protein
MSSRLFMTRALQSTLGKAGLTEKAIWAFPALTLVSWILWPAMDQEFMQGLGLEPDPEAGVKTVQAAKDARMLIRMPAASAVSMAAADKDEEEDDEEEEDAAAEVEEEEASGEEEEEKEEEEEAAADEEEDEEKEAEEEEEDEEEEKTMKPLYVPLKGDKLSLEELWDNFTIKAVRTNEDDPFEDDEEEDEEEEEGK